MSLISSLYTGYSGLETSSDDLTVIGDNIANADTVGFKASRADFEDALAQTIIGAGQIGGGSRLQAIQKLLSQGAITGTTQVTDLAIDGGGLFVLKGSHSGIDTTYYSRAGQFVINKSGFLINQEGLVVQGYNADSAGTIGSQVGDLQLGNASTAPRPTDTVTLKANLDAGAPVDAAAWSAANPSLHTQYSTGVTIYDSLGQAHAATVWFQHDQALPSRWQWHVTTDGGGVAGGTAGTPVEIANGTLTFDATGALATSTVGAATFTPNTGQAGAQPLTFNFGDPTATPGNTGLLGITQFAGTSSTTFTNQNGYAAGSLAAISIDQQGVVTGAFTNGTSRALGQVVLATFPAADQLNRAGGNLFSQTRESGDPSIGAAGSGGRGSIHSGALEQSNVDLANEFIHMITAQRNFQANAKTISTADQLLSDLVNNKR